MPAYRIDGHAVSERDGMRWNQRWFERMLLPEPAEVAGPFTPIEIARHRAWGLEERYNRSAVYAPMQDDADPYNGGFWPMVQCDPAETIAVGGKHGRIYRACVFTY